MYGFQKACKGLCCCLLVMQLPVWVQKSQRVTELKELLFRVYTHASMFTTDSAAIRIRQAQAAAPQLNWLPNLKQQVHFEYNSIPGKNYKATISRSANALSTMWSEAVEIGYQ